MIAVSNNPTTCPGMLLGGNIGFGHQVFLTVSDFGFQQLLMNEDAELNIRTGRLST